MRRIGAAGVAGQPAHSDGLAALQQAGGGQGADDQIGRDDRDIERGDVVALVRFGHIVAVVGTDLQPPLAGRQGRHGDAEALRQGGSGGQGAHGPARAQALGGVQAADVDEADVLAEEGADGVIAAVAHQVVDLQRLTDAPVGGRSEAFDDQIGLGLGAHGAGLQRSDGVVVDAAELIDGRKGIGLDDEVARPSGVARDREVQRCGITLAHSQRARPGDRSHQRGLRGQRGCAAQIDLIDPAVDVGGDRAAVADGPRHMGAAPGEHLGRHQGQGRGQVGIGLRDRDGRGQTQVVGPGVGLAHGAVGVTQQGDAPAALDARGNAHGGALGVAAAHVQGAGVFNVEQHDVVGVAENAVAREHDAIRPGRGGRGRAVVDDRPTDDGVSAGCGRVGHDQRADRQIGVGPRLSDKAAHGAVVRLGVARQIGFEQQARACRIAVGGDGDIEVARTQRAVGQVEAEAAPARLAGGQGQRRIAREGRRRVDDHRPQGAVRIALAHHDAVLIGHGGGHRALVDIVPAQLHQVARQRTGLHQRHIAHRQVGARAEGLLAGVVSLQRTAGTVLRQLTQGIDGDAQAEVANRVQATGPCEGRIARRAGTGLDALRVERDQAAQDDDAGAQIDQFDALTPGADCGNGACVGGVPAHRDAVASIPVQRRLDRQAGQLQIGVVSERATERQAAAVVLFRCAALSLLIVHIGLDNGDQIAGADRAVRQAQDGAAGDKLIAQQRAVRRIGFDVGHQQLRDHLVGVSAAQDHAVGEVTQRGLRALVAHRPLHAHLAAGAQVCDPGCGCDAELVHHQVHRRWRPRQVDMARLTRTINVGHQSERYRHVVGQAVVQHHGVAAADAGDELGITELRVSHRAAIGIDHPQRRRVVVVIDAQRAVVGIGARGQIAQVEEQPVARLRLNTVAQGRTGLQAAVHQGAAGQRRCRLHVQQTEGVEQLGGVTGGHAQRVAACQQRKAGLVGCAAAVAQVASLHIGPRGGVDQRPIEIPGSAVESVELHHRIGGQLQVVLAGLAGGVERARQRLAQLRGRAHLTGDVVDLEGHAAALASATAIAHPVEDDVHRAGVGDRQRGPIRIGKRPARERLAETVEKRKARRAAARVQGIELEHVARLCVHPPGSGGVSRSAGGGDGLTEGQRGHLHRLVVQAA